MHKSSVIVGLISALSICMVPGNASPIPDSDLEDALLYRSGYASLLVQSPKSLPFFLLVDNAQTGYLVDFGPAPNGSPVGLAPNGVPGDWARTKDSLAPNKNKAWMALSQKQAQALWGKPVGHYMAGATDPYFYTFDAHGSFNGEKNIYHLDLRFGPNELPFGYRVRGIGISNAKWIMATPDGRQTVKVNN